MKISKRTVVITNRLGLHARASAKLKSLAVLFEDSTIYIRRTHDEHVDGDEFDWEPIFNKDIDKMRLHRIADAKSPMSLMLAAIGVGEEIEIAACGEHSDQAVLAISSLFHVKFGEDQ